MDYLPIFVKLDNKRCLLVGGGKVAARKLTLLTQASAQVTVVATEFCDEIVELSQQHSIELIQDTFHSKYLTDVDLVFAATDDEQVNSDIYQLASARNLFVNVVDDQSKCSFIMPSIVDRGPVTIAIGTGGKAPVLARLLRGKIESVIPHSYGKLAELAARYRQRVKQLLPSGTSRKNFWEQVFEGSIGQKVLTGSSGSVERELESLLQHYQVPNL